MPKSVNTKNMLVLQNSPEHEILPAAVLTVPESMEFSVGYVLCFKIGSCLQIMETGSYATIVQWQLRPAFVAASWPVGLQWYLIYVCVVYTMSIVTSKGERYSLVIIMFFSYKRRKIARTAPFSFEGTHPFRAI